MTPKVIVVAGPTASGKTRLGIELAKKYRGEIVSADSMQVYKGMDIGTAKASAEERAEVRHHLIDVAQPRENYSVSCYVQAAAEVCDGLIADGKLPVIVGGTGLYIDSLLSGRAFADTQQDKELRRALESEYDALGAEEMWRRLRQVDPERADKLAPSDKRRILRALEIYMLTGSTATQHDAQTRALPPRYDAAYIVLGYKNRQDLYDRIDRRVSIMVSDGLFDEVRALLDGGLSPDCTAMQAIGYKEAAEYLRGDISREEAISKIKMFSRRYAKRQITWFGRREDALRIFFDSVPDFEYALQVSSDFLLLRGIS